MGDIHCVVVENPHSSENRNIYSSVPTSYFRVSYIRGMVRFIDNSIFQSIAYLFVDLRTKCDPMALMATNSKQSTFKNRPISITEKIVS